MVQKLGQSALSVYYPCCGEHPYRAEDFVIAPGGGIEVTCPECKTKFQVSFEFQEIEEEEVTASLVEGRQL